MWKGQRRIIEDHDHDLLAVISGYGYGKTTVGIRWHFQRVLQNPFSPLSMVVGADYRLLKEVCFPFYTSYLESLGLIEGYDFKCNKTAPSITFKWGIGQKIIFISAEKPKKIASYTVSHALFDEPARCTNDANNNLVGRVRCPRADVRTQILYTTTPEGLNWFYDLFNPEGLTKEGRFSESKNKLVLHGSSFDNPDLPENFFTNHLELFGWDSDLFTNYMMGNWTNLSKDKFYFSFKDSQHVKDNTIDLFNKDLYLSFDNNVGHMTWITAQRAYDQFRTISDNGGNGRNLDDACKQFIDQYPPSIFSTFNIRVHGDAVLHHRSVHSYDTGYDIIKKILSKHYKNVIIEAKKANPRVEEKNRHTNRLFEKGRIVVGKKCKKLIESLRSTELKDGKAKKGSKDLITHAGEALDMLLINAIEPLSRIDANGISW